MNVAALMRAVARRQPGRPAVAMADTTLSYGDLLARSAAMAGAFGALGLARGDRVALWMENCPDYIECLAACWTAGLAAVPVNAKLHWRELAYILENCGAKLLVTTAALAEEAAKAAGETGCRTVCTGSAEYRRLLAGDPVAPVQTEPDDLAWLFYTSGTTGRPKGAMLSHRNLVAASLCYLSDTEHVTPDHAILHAAPLSHGSGLYGVPFLLSGALQIVMPGFDPGAVADVLARHERVSFFAAPTMLTRLVNAPAASRIDPGRIGTISYGGGPMYVADLERALAAFGPRLFQLYGQGEAPMTITGLNQAQHVGGGGPPLRERLASCGVPRSGCLVRVVDGEDRDLPPGEVGEVITRSDVVMTGYWGNPDASAAALRGGWLHTGDLGSLDGHGFLTLRDRSKDLIISGGTNIYPREIEEVLLRHPAVLEASVIGRPHPDWGEEIVAFVVRQPGQTVAEPALDRLLLDNLARFKRPKHYRFVEALPKNNYGKVLKTELRRSLEGETAT